MMPTRMEGFRICQSLSSALVTVTKSPPKNTRSTPSTANRRLANGDAAAVSAPAKSIVPFSITTRPGRNFRVDGLGVCSVWINKIASEVGRKVSDPQKCSTDVGTKSGPIKMILRRFCTKVMETSIIFVSYGLIKGVHLRIALVRYALCKAWFRATFWKKVAQVLAFTTQLHRLRPRSVRPAQW